MMSSDRFGGFHTKLGVVWVSLMLSALSACSLPIGTSQPAGPDQRTASPGSGAQTAESSAAGAAAADTRAAVSSGAAPAAAPPPAPPIAFDDALLQAANNLFAKAALPADAPARVPLVIDPLVDGVTGAQSAATRSMGQRIVAMVHDRYPRFEVVSFSAEAVARQPVVLIGTFTPINHAGRADGPRDAYRICLALADLKAGRIISKGVARALPAGFDTDPTPFFDDSPAWTRDPAVDAYVRTCQGTRPGDAIDTLYADRIVAAALIAEAINAYDEGRYRDALDLYRSALQIPGGDQLRAWNGIYLTTRKLGRQRDAMQAFAKLVDYGLEHSRLAVKFLFRPGSTQFAGEHELSDGYPMWLEQIAKRAAGRSSCLEIVGHTSPTGPAALNDRLSHLRAQYVQRRLEAEAPPLARRTIANGVGSRENLVGTGRDDASDALDRRVEFRVIDCVV